MLGTFAYIGTQEIMIIAGVAILLFGGAKIPQLAKGLGEGIREFKKSMGDDEPAKPAAPVTTPTATTEEK